MGGCFEGVRIRKWVVFVDVERCWWEIGREVYGVLDVQKDPIGKLHATCAVYVVRHCAVQVLV